MIRLKDPSTVRRQRAFTVARELYLMLFVLGTYLGAFIGFVLL